MVEFKIPVPHIFTELSEEESATKLYSAIADINGYSSIVTKKTKFEGTKDEFETALHNSPDVYLESSENGLYIWFDIIDVATTETKEQYGKNFLGKILLPYVKKAVVFEKTKDIKTQLNQIKELNEQTEEFINNAITAAVQGITPT